MALVLVETTGNGGDYACHPMDYLVSIQICGDCHTAFKIVSQVVGREIVLRDTN